MTMTLEECRGACVVCGDNKMACAIDAAISERDELRHREHCDGCGCTWIDDGLNPTHCPYCELAALKKRIAEALGLIDQAGCDDV